MVKAHIDNSIAKIRTLYEAASVRIEALKPGEKIPATQLAEDLAKDMDTTGPALYPVLKMLFDGYPGIIIKRGAQGGLFRPVVEAPAAVDNTEEAK